MSTATGTKQKLLDSALALMLTRGFSETSIEDVCAAAEVTKGGFFHYFKNKESFGKAVTRHYWENMRAGWDGASFRARQDPLDRIYGFLDHYIMLSKDPAIELRCLLGNFAQELSDSHDAIRKTCVIYLAEWTEYLKKDLDEAKKRYLPKARLDTQSLAEYIVSAMEGSLLLARANRDRRINTRNFEHLRRHLKSIFEIKETKKT